MIQWNVQPFWAWWAAMMAEESVNVMIDRVANLRTAAAAEQREIREIEKRLKRRQRWLDRRTGRGYLWS